MKFILIVVLVAGILFVAYVVFQFKQKPLSNDSTQPSSNETLERGINPARLIGVNENYLKLDSILYQLTQSIDHVAYAKRYELNVVNNNVRVEIELQDTNFKLPTDFGIEDKRTGAFLQALVPIGKLVELTDDVRILAIRIPEK